MRFLSSAHTDIGISKTVNQDSFCLKCAKTPISNIAMAIMCDGMGGLSKGEYASSFVVNAFSKWFETELPLSAGRPIDLQTVAGRWNQIVIEQGQKIMNFGSENGITLGTTCTGLLIVNNEYLCIHVGDSRLYVINDSIQQITKDHTVAELENEKNKTEGKQIQTFQNSSVLYQCIGASRQITPEVHFGAVSLNDVFLLCSDGFRHQVSAAEMFGVLAPQLMTSEKIIKKSLVDLTELNKSRRESDNLTAILIKAIR